LNPTHFQISVGVMPITTIIIVLVGVLLNNANMNACFRGHQWPFRRYQRFDPSVLGSAGCQPAPGRNELLGKFAELDNRLNRIERHLNLG
jgi:hypothetical protein